MEGTARLSRKKVILDFDVEFTLVTSERKWWLPNQLYTSVAPESNMVTNHPLA